MDGKQRDQNGSTDLTPTMQAGQDSEGGVDGCEQMCTLHAGGVLCVWLS
jgi:hypothetical protein